MLIPRVKPMFSNFYNQPAQGMGGATMASTKKQNKKTEIKPSKGQSSISAFFAAVPKKVSDGQDTCFDTLQLSTGDADKIKLLRTTV